MNLPQRSDQIHHLSFNLRERQKYERAKAQARTLFEEAISTGVKEKANINALQHLNILRLICSHGLFTQNDLYNNAAEELEDTFWSPPLICAKCGETRPMDITDNIPTHFSDLSSDDRDLCICTYDTRASNMALGLSGNSAYSKYNRLSSSSPSTFPNPTAEVQESADFNLMSTKVKALVGDLLTHHQDEKWSVLL